MIVKPIDLDHLTVDPKELHHVAEVVADHDRQLDAAL
jgi:hypothetical protein